MRYQVPNKELFIKNRQKFVAQMKPNTAAVFFSNKILPVNADAHYLFNQDSSFYYLTGIDQEGCILFLFPDAPKDEWKQVLFVLETNEKIAVWEGWKYSKDEAKAASGIEKIQYTTGFEDFILYAMLQIEGFYLDFNEHDRNRLFVETAAHHFANRLKREFPAHSIHRATPILYALRSVKEPQEIDQLKRACEITTGALHRVAKFIKPGVKEYEIEAEVLHEFLKNGATGAAYTSIIASGKNACTLHYIQNEAVCNDGEVILMDFGAKYGNYSADLTRCLPVNGKFTDRQRAIYDAVLRTFRLAMSKLVVGTKLEDYTKEVKLFAQEEMVKLGLLTKEDLEKVTEEKPAYEKYLMHGISHHLGLDTHDSASRYTPLKAGMVLTCEPGFYIPAEGIGIRIETDVLITDKQPIDLFPNVPLEAKEIEELMKKK